MKRHELKWDGALKQWFCVECGRTSHHVGKLIAEEELNQFDCSEPQRASDPGRNSPRTKSHF